MFSLMYKYKTIKCDKNINCKNTITCNQFTTNLNWMHLIILLCILFLFLSNNCCCSKRLTLHVIKFISQRAISQLKHYHFGKWHIHFSPLIFLRLKRDLLNLVLISEVGKLSSFWAIKINGLCNSRTLCDCFVISI